MDTKDSLDFYATIEPLLGFYESYDYLYEIYLKEINALFEGDKRSLRAIDFGCGNGKFTRLLSAKFDVLGVDKSQDMRKQNSSIKTAEFLPDLMNDCFVITAVSDVLNYLSSDEILSFFDHAYKLLESGGYLIFDLNTEFGFGDVASGSLYIKDGKNDLIIDANYEAKKLFTKFLYFKNYDDVYKKFEYNITQHYHSPNFITKNSPFKLIKRLPVYIFSDESPDKEIFIFRK